MKSLALSLLVFAVSLVTDVARAAAPELPEGLLPAGYQVSERHVMNLGGSSGMYTDWQRYDLTPFEGLATMLEIPAVHGKPKDKFAAVTKIRFIWIEGENSGLGDLAIPRHARTACCRQDGDNSGSLRDRCPGCCRFGSGCELLAICHTEEGRG